MNKVSWPPRNSTSELLCRPFLDTDMPDDVRRADEELSKRGYPKWATKVIRVIFLVGLWTQAFIWEEFHLDISDVAAGYGLIFCGLSIPLLISAAIFHSVTPVKLAGLSFLLGCILLSLASIGWSRYRKKSAAEVLEMKKRGLL